MAQVLRLQGEKKRKRQKAILIISGIALFVLLAILYTFVMSTKFRVTTFTVEGARTISQNELIKVAEETLAAKRFGFVPGNHMVLFDALHLEETLRKAFPRIQTIFFSREVPNGMRITLTERQAFAVWCEDYGIECLFIDHAGVAYGDAPSFSNPVFVEYVGDVPEIGKPYASEKDFHEISSFIAKLKTESIVIHVVVKQEDGSYAAFLARPEFDKELPPRIIFGGPGSDMSKTFDRFIIAWRESPLQGKPIHELGLEYIDVRFGNKVFYKKK